jgi:hypothetical protein
MRTMLGVAALDHALSAAGTETHFRRNAFGRRTSRPAASRWIAAVRKGGTTHPVAHRMEVGLHLLQLTARKRGGVFLVNESGWF